MCTNTPAVDTRPKFFALLPFRCIVYTKNLAWGWGYLAVCQHSCVNRKWPMGWLYCCFVTFIGATLNLLQCLCDICGCRAIQTNSAETSLSMLVMYSVANCHNIISSGSPPVFLECGATFLTTQCLHNVSCYCFDYEMLDWCCLWIFFLAAMDWT